MAQPNRYIKSVGRQFNVPTLCYIDGNNIQRIDVCASLQLKAEAAQIIQNCYEEDEMEDWLWYLFLDKKYKKLAEVFSCASWPQQVDLFFRFKQQLIDDVDAALAAKKAKLLKNKD